MADKCKNCSRLIIVEEKTTCVKCGKPMHKDCAVKTRKGDFCDVCFEVQEESPSAPTLPDSIRRSYIDDYENCPYSAYLDIIKGIELPGSSFAEVGILLHEIFEEYYIELHRPTKEIMIKSFAKGFKKIKKECFEFGVTLYKEKTLEQHMEDMYNLGLECIDNFLILDEQWQMQPNRKTIALEEKIVMDIGEAYPKVQITMDRLDEVDGELEVIDYKSGNVMVGKELQDNLQVPLYIIAVEHKYKRKVKRFVLHYLHENKTRVYERIDDDTFRCTVRANNWYNVSLNKTLERVKIDLSNMAKGKWDIPSDFKSMYFKCKTCAKKRYGYCEGAESQIWKTKTEFSW